jgi:hypothetical protein
MDVSLSLSRAFLSVLGLSFLLVSCGNRYDLATERGRQARIDDANFFLSKGECGAALEAIEPVYSSPQVDDEVRIIRASAYACAATYNLLTMAGNFAGASDQFAALAKSMGNSNGDGARGAIYQAVDVLTENGNKLVASQRSVEVNNYMVFLQLGVMGAILRNYGSPAADGAQGANLIYNGNGGSPAGEMSDVDACALAASLSFISDSFSGSSLNDGDTASFANSINTMCVAAGLTSCNDISKSRNACTGGNNADSQRAELIVTGINGAWNGP